MSNLRIIYDNAADRATLVASTEASAAMEVENLQTDIKGEVWRSTGTSATITATWSTAQTIAGVMFPFANFTSQATIRVRGYAEVADPSPLFDTTAIAACPAPILGLWNWGNLALGSNAYSYGGGTVGRVWVAVPGAVKKIVVDIVDTTNPAGYVEAGRLVCGAYWSPSQNAEYGAQAAPVDASKHYRTDGRDLRTDVFGRHKKLNVSLPMMSPTDRASLWSILIGNGMPRPIFFSLFPNHEDATLEQTHQLYGKLAASPAVSVASFQRYATSIDIEEI